MFVLGRLPSTEKVYTVYCVDEVTFNFLINQNLQMGLAPRFVAVISPTRVN